jgi:hypothetical protein
MEDKLWIFAVQSYGAQASFDGGESYEDFDQEPVIVGHQYAKSLSMAAEAMAQEVAENVMGISKPDFYDKEDPTDEEDKAIVDYNETVEGIQGDLMHFELVVGNNHSIFFAN